MKAENMIIPQNARIVWNGKNFNIEPEKLGRQIDIEKAADAVGLKSCNFLAFSTISLDDMHFILTFPL